MRSDAGNASDTGLRLWQRSGQSAIRLWRGRGVRFLALFATLSVAGALGGCDGFFIDGHTSTVLTSSAVSAVSGTSITLTATVSTKSATGTVNFYDGTTMLGTGTLSSGVATYAATALATGSHSLTAEYLGDTNYKTSTSSAVTVVISTALTATTTALSVLPATATTSTGVAHGASLMFTAVVVSSAATGSITFNAVLSGTSTILPLGTAVLSTGSATYTATAPTTAGQYSVSATYSGDSNYATSTSVPFTVTVN